MHVSWYLFGCARYRSPKSVSDKGPPFDTPMRDVTHYMYFEYNFQNIHSQKLSWFILKLQMLDTSSLYLNDFPDDIEVIIDGNNEKMLI